MKVWIKAALLSLLAAGAVYSAAHALGGIQEGSGVETKIYNYEWSCAMDEAAYVLRDYNGYVAVFASAEARDPMTVTDIEVDRLRGTDQDMLGAGIAVSDRDELLMLLEDLGS